MKDDRINLLHIQEAIGWIEQYTEDGKDAFLSDRKSQDAVLRNLEVIGEAVKHISQPLKLERPEIPWKRMAGMRDKLIHEYFGVNLELVWDVTASDLPKINKALNDILTGLKSG